MKAYLTRMAGGDRVLLTRFKPVLVPIKGAPNLTEPYAIVGDPLNTKECYRMSRHIMGIDIAPLQTVQIDLRMIPMSEPTTYTKGNE